MASQVWLSIILLCVPFINIADAACNYEETWYPSDPSAPVTGGGNTCYCSGTSWINCKPISTETPAYKPHVLPQGETNSQFYPHPVTAVEQRDQFLPEEFVFDLFGRAPASNGYGGTIRPVFVGDLPSLKGQGVSYVLIRLEPCGINLPHVHPRATEIIAVIEGEGYQVMGFAEENGGGEAVINTLHKGEVTFFPQGLIHYQQNLGCKEAVYIASLNSEDPGVITAATQLFTLPNEALQATFATDEYEVKKLRGRLPAGPAEGREACLKKCGIWGRE
eukprot:GHVQ01003257.1.p1 GENE.GHVQ01003257.1~~GHVQ01003257.1.p1  ORF type:complete len:277 (+),score=31.97 GHVQ01003257.1:976-1806(+)